MKKEEVKLYAKVAMSHGGRYNNMVARICSDKIIEAV